MSVKETKAREAWDTFRYHMTPSDLPGHPGVSLSWPPTKELVSYTWRMMAARLHPDVGGNASTFMAVKDAKDALVDYLQAESPAAPKPRGKAGQCAACDGAGTVLVSSGKLGAKGLRKRCAPCGGTGEDCG